MDEDDRVRPRDSSPRGPAPGGGAGRFAQKSDSVFLKVLDGLVRDFRKTFSFPWRRSGVVKGLSGSDDEELIWDEDRREAVDSLEGSSLEEDMVARRG